MSALWPCGVLGRPHGLKGEIALDPSPGGVEYLAQGTCFFVAKGDRSPVPVVAERCGGADRRPLLRLEGVDTREAAAVLSGSILLAAGPALDGMPHYLVGDLVGLPAVCGDRELGIVADVLQGVAQDILQITAPGGEEELVPLVDALVTVDRVAGVIHIREGLL